MSLQRESFKQALLEQKNLLEQRKDDLSQRFLGRFVAFANGAVLADGATYEEVATQVFGEDGRAVPDQPVLITRVQSQERPVRISQVD